MARAPSQTSCPACRGPMENGFCTSLQDERYFDLHLTLWLKTMFPDAKRRAPDSVCTKTSEAYEKLIRDRLTAFFQRCSQSIASPATHQRRSSSPPYRYISRVMSVGGKCTFPNCGAEFVSQSHCSKRHRLGDNTGYFCCSQCQHLFVSKSQICSCGFIENDLSIGHAPFAVKHWRGNPVPKEVFRFQEAAKNKSGRCSICNAPVRGNQCQRGHLLGVIVTRCSQCDTPFLPPKRFCECGFHLDDVPQKR